MTIKEFDQEVARLAAGFRKPFTAERASALYDKLARYSRPAMHAAVSRVLCEPRYPSFDDILREVDYADRQLRQTRLEQERREAQLARCLHEDKPVTAANGDAQHQPEVSYNRMRMRLLLDREAGTVAERHVNGLTRWLVDPANVAWATDARIENCHPKCAFYRKPHSVFMCLRKELAYWLEVSANTYTCQT